MITTLKITTIFAAVVCISLLGFVGAFGLRGDPRIEQFINSPRFLEEYKNVVTKAPSTEGRISPLVKAAQEFALRIDPPPPPEPPKPPAKQEKPSIGPKPPVVTTTETAPPPAPPSRFDLIATCRYEHDPAKSMALLDLPGKGLTWIRVGENIEHLVLTEVEDGSIKVSQTGREPQVVAMKKEQPLARNLLLEPGQTLDIPTSKTLEYERIEVAATPASLGKGNAYIPPQGSNRAPRVFAPPGAAAPGLSSAQPASTATARQPRTYVPPSRPRTPTAQPTVEQRKAVLDENIADLKNIMNQPSSTTTNKDEAAEEQKALAKLLELLEQERKTAAEQSKVTTEKPKQGE